jgi:serine/threonine protein kinase
LKKATEKTESSHVSGERRIDLSGGFAAGHVIAERYRILEKIGEGGMSQVFSAHDLLEGRDVALKIMMFDGKNRAYLEARFQREIDIASQLKSRVFVPMYDHGISDNAYIAMELLTGENLQERLSREGRLSLAATLNVLWALSTGLREAHDLCIIHRDLKPSNIFFANSGEEETIRILDFGIAKDLWSPEKLTRKGYVLGSQHYMSPEQAAGKEVDARSDLWSVAVVLYRCLTGRRPFEGKIGTLILQIANERHPQATSVASGLPPAIDAFFDQALAKRPENRFPDIMSMLKAFKHVVDHAAQVAPPITKRPPTTPSSPTQAGDVSYGEYARLVSSDPESQVPTIEAPLEILERHSTEEPLHAFPPSRWEAMRNVEIHSPSRQEFLLYIAIGFVLLSLIAFGAVVWMTGLK